MRSMDPTRERELVDVLMDRVRQVAQEAGRSAATSAHAVEFVREVYDHREDLRGALATLDRIESDDQFNLFINEIGRAYVRDPQRLTRSGLRTDLLTEWIDLLLEALTEVRAVLARADDFAAQRGAETDDDREFRGAIRNKIASRWQT